MSVLFDGVGTKYVKWAAADLTGVVGLTSKTISFWYYPDGTVGTGVFIISDETGTDTDEYFMVSHGNGGKKVSLVSHFSTQDGEWRTNNAVLTSGAQNHVVVSYNGGATANNPVIYINGVSNTNTRISAPIGTYRVGTTTNLYIGNYLVPWILDGNVADVRIYNTILTAAQVLSLYNAGAFTSSFDTNLVFNAPLTSATALGGAEYNWFTLTSSQKLIDRINCIEGTPSGSPLGSSTNPGGKPG